MSPITIVLLCHNRPAFAENAIKSILNQTEKNFRFVVSDNSSNRELQEVMKARYPKVEYISRFPGIPFLEHFKEVISFVDTQYFVMFHDDDSLEPDFVGRILEEFKKEPLASAIGTNAWVIDGNGNKNLNQTTYVGPEEIKVISCRKVLLRQYLASDFGGIVPFCSYAFNTELIKGVMPNFSMRDNFDTYFLMEVVDRGPILWINEPLVGARRHENNRSHISGVCCYKPFVNIGRDLLGSIIKQSHIDEYHFLRLFFLLKKNQKRPAPAIKYLIRVFPKLMIVSHSFRKRIFKKIFS
ncbi:MAG: glycosyltransferase [Nitrospina sp.]|jgi:glycosyltransferase involved in cell wall biosynthesis|nr:glycosyltransferase [Nitrospina sp.]MBT5633878.1 glycosyltransferase [Nitrospina sp.]